MKLLLLLSCLLLLPGCHATGATSHAAVQATGTPDGPFVEEIEAVADHPYTKLLVVTLSVAASLVTIVGFVLLRKTPSNPHEPPLIN